MDQFGNLAWARKRGGWLTTFEKILFVASAGKSAIARRLRRRKILYDLPYERLNLDKIIFPNTRLINMVSIFCENYYEPWLLNHCLRTYLWAGLVAQMEGIRFDPEHLLSICMLHDMGLTRYRRAEKNGECFAVRGGRLAEKILSDLGNPKLALAAEESISMHLNIFVPRQEPSLDYLLHQGAAMDVMGWGLRKVGTMKEKVVERHPRLDFKNKFIARLTEEATEHPDTRLTLLIRLGFLKMIQKAPFTE